KPIDPNSPQVRLAGRFVARIGDHGIVHQIGLPITDDCMEQMHFLRDPGDLREVVKGRFPVCLTFTGEAFAPARRNELALLKNVAALDVREHLVTDEALRDVAVLTNLRALAVYGTGLVTDAGLKHLTALKDLEVLYLSSTNISDTGLKDLAAFKNLRMISISSDKVTDKGLRE